MTWEVLNTKIVSLKLFLRGDVSLAQFARKLLPTAIRPSRKGVVRLFGNPFLCADTSEFLALYYEIVHANQYHVELIKNNGTVVDAGANVGVFSVLAAVKHPGATIFAFEPAPATFEILKENVKHYSNIRVFNCALGEREGVISFVITPNAGTNHVGNGGIPIPMKTIDSLGTRVDFLKMDTEGYEANIIKGAVETIKKWKPVIAMPAYHKPDDKTELPALLSSITPYNCELHHEAEEDLICQPQRVDL
jgi:FkbM family methyltransferase